MSDSSKTKLSPLLKDGFSYYFFFKYYPIRYQVEEKFQKYRKLIWNFKDGKITDEFYKTVAKAFNIQPDWWICVIPASTKEKTEIRFKRFCEVFSAEIGINNGYSLISNRIDRVAVHLQEDRSSVNLIDTIDFGSVSGKRILLFDDIYTTGKSFVLVAQRLTSLGATKVVGIFLGKTHWLENEENTNEFPLECSKNN